MLGMGDPRVHALSDLVGGYRARAPAVPQAAQAVAKAAHVVFGKSPSPAPQQDKSQKGGGLIRRGHERLRRMKTQTAAFQITGDTLPPFLQSLRVVVKRAKSSTYLR